jgi:uncharacterized membrane protein YqhA
MTAIFMSSHTSRTLLVHVVFALSRAFVVFAFSFHLIVADAIGGFDCEL